MQVLERIIPYKRSDVFPLYLVGDIHCGTIHCAEDEIRSKVQEIKSNPQALWLGMGDYAEWITPFDKRWDPSQKAVASWLEQDNIAECQRKWIKKLFEPIRKQCIGLLYGNHEESIRHCNHDNVLKNVCDDLELENLGYSCFVDFIFRREGSKEAHQIRGAFTHGTGNARTDSGKVNYLARFMSDFDAQLYGYAHTHTIYMLTPTNLGIDKRDTIEGYSKIGALTGCFFRTYTQGVVASYGEQKVYKPTRIGCPKFNIYPDDGEVGIEIKVKLW